MSLGKVLTPRRVHLRVMPRRYAKSFPERGAESGFGVETYAVGDALGLFAALKQLPGLIQTELFQKLAWGNFKQPLEFT